MTARRATVFLVLSIVLSSLVGVVLSLRTGLRWEGVLATRGAFAVLGLAAWMYFTRSPIDISVATVVGGVAWALTFTLFIVATLVVGSEITMALEAASPLFAIALGWKMLRERPKASDLGPVLVFALGLVAVVLPAVGVGSAPGERDGQGAHARHLAFGVLESVTYAGAIVMTRRIERQRGCSGDSRSALLIGNVLALLVGLCVAGVRGTGMPDSATIGLCAFLGLFQIGLAFGLLGAALSVLPSWVGSIGLGAGLACNLVWMSLRHWKWPDPADYVVWGNCLIATASVWLTWTRFRNGTDDEGPRDGSRTGRVWRFYLRKPRAPD